MTTSPRLSPQLSAQLSGQAAPPPARATARKEIGVFLGTVAVLLTATTVIAASQDADVRHVDQAPPLVQALLFGQALIPLLAALLARFVTAGSLRRPGWGFRRPSWRALGRAWLWALVTTLAGGALVWATGTGAFRTEGLDAVVPLGLTVLVAPYVLLALAEDVGWRGLLVTRLAQVADPRTVVLVGGLAWSAFHAPLIVFLGGAPEGVPVAWALLCFAVGTTAFGAVLASMQLRWGIWPGVLAHAVVNAALYHVLDPLTGDTGSTGWFATESGLFPALALVGGAVVWSRWYPLRRTAAGGTQAADS
ncbi:MULTISPECIES: CPBP family intramembrane glutamic endopeptidase [unclassified Blastococcus]